MIETSPPIRIVVVDDQPLFVHGLSMLVESQDDLQLVGTAADGAEALAVVTATAPDVVLMDIRMPAMSGLEATSRIRNSTSGVPEARPQVVMLTTFGQREAVLRSMRSGAAAFLTKDATPEEVLETIRSVHRGDAMPDRLMRLLEDAVHEGADGAAKTGRGARDGLLATLTPREREILLLAAKGLRNSEIAASAFVSEATVKTHISRILAKLGLRSRAQVIVLAHENGLVSR